MELYIGLENEWEGEIPGLIEGRDYLRTGSIVFIKTTVTPYSHPSVKLVNYLRLPRDHLVNMKELSSPVIKWVMKEWPRSVGRYRPDESTVVDVVFGSIDLPAGVSERYVTDNRGYWREWYYDTKSAELAMIVMKLVSEVSSVERTPHRLVRHLTAAANSVNRKDGLMVGNWSDDFSDGKLPSYWKRTRDVLSNYLHKGSVKYAQCWVFSEVLTSIFRFLGIPSRTIYADNAHIDLGRDGGVDMGLAVSKGEGENFFGAIKIDVKSMKGGKMGYISLSNTVSVPFDVVVAKGDSRSLRLSSNVLDDVPPDDVIKVVSKGDPVDRVVRGDSTWNFHLWNETFIYRPDLLSFHEGKGYGWQCSDASPMIPTDSKDQYAGKKLFGPVPVSAIKKGKNVPHDYRYMFSSVNSAYRFWRREMTEEGDLVTYPYDIVFPQFEKRRIGDVKVRLYTQDADGSVAEVTNNYTPDEATVRKIHLQNHPIVYSYKGALEIRDFSDKSYHLQVCYLNKSGSLLAYSRRLLERLGDFNFLPPVSCERISIFLAEEEGEKWWVQLIKL